MMSGFPTQLTELYSDQSDKILVPAALQGAGPAEPHALVLQAEWCPPMSSRAPRSRAGACLGALFQIFTHRGLILLPTAYHGCCLAQASPVNDGAHAGHSLGWESPRGHTDQEKFVIPC